MTSLWLTVFSGNHQPFAVGRPEFDTGWDQPMDPSARSATHRGGLSSLDRQPMPEACRTWSCSSMAPPFCNCCAVNLQGVSLSGQRVCTGVWRLSRLAPAAAKPFQVKVAAS